MKRNFAIKLVSYLNLFIDGVLWAIGTIYLSRCNISRVCGALYLCQHSVCNQVLASSEKILRLFHR